jgi:hypothetical protein
VATVEGSSVAGAGRVLGSGLERVVSAPVDWNAEPWSIFERGTAPDARPYEQLDAIDAALDLGPKMLFLEPQSSPGDVLTAPRQTYRFSEGPLCWECVREGPCDCGSPGRCRCTCGDCLRDVDVEPTSVVDLAAGEDAVLDGRRSFAWFDGKAWTFGPVSIEEEEQWRELERRLAQP